MRRSILLLLLITGTVLSNATTRAAGSPSRPANADTFSRAGSSGLRDLLSHLTPPRKSHLHAKSVYRQTVTGAIQSAPQMKIPFGSSYPPSDFQVFDNSPYAAADIDDHGISLNIYQKFLLHYDTGYRNLGAMGVWDQESGKNLADGSLFLISYLGTYYGNPDSASNAFNNVVSNTAAPFQLVGWNFTVVPKATTCIENGASQCLDVSFKGLPGTFLFNNPNSPNVYDINYRILLKSNALFEGGYVVSEANFATQQSTAVQYRETLIAAWLSIFNGPVVPTSGPPPTTGPQPTAVPPTAVPPTAPPPTVAIPTIPPVTNPPPALPTATKVPVRTEFHIVTVRWEQAGHKRALDNVPVTKTKSGAKISLVMYFQVTGGQPAVPFTVSFAILHNGQSVGKGKISGRLNASDPVGIYTASLNYTVPSQSGTYKGKVTLSLAGQSQAGTSANLKVAKKK